MVGAKGIRGRLAGGGWRLGIGSRDWVMGSRYGGMSHSPIPTPYYLICPCLGSEGFMGLR
jgi:hypothetical protein